MQKLMYGIWILDWKITPVLPRYKVFVCLHHLLCLWHACKCQKLMLRTILWLSLSASSGGKPPHSNSLRRSEYLIETSSLRQSLCVGTHSNSLKKTWKMRFCPRRTSEVKVKSCTSCMWAHVVLNDSTCYVVLARGWQVPHRILRTVHGHPHKSWAELPAQEVWACNEKPHGNAHAFETWKIKNTRSVN